MRIQGHSVDMSAQYFGIHTQSLQTSTTDISESQSNESFNSDKSDSIKKLEIDLKKTQEAKDRLTQEIMNSVFIDIASNVKTTNDRLTLSSIEYDKQSLNFQTKAFIQTQDKEIELSLDISLDRSFMQKIDIDIEIFKPLQDPLIISLDSTMPSLNSKTFSFDIDSNGESDQISQLNKGNGFLALDANSNGIIDNGNELFGTKSGDGFKDLSKYDDDKNGWIDENDAIFDKLRFWQKSEGKDELLALGEVGIGAIFLQNVDTPFSLKSDTNELLGEIRKSSIVLLENGKSGVISQVDLAVTPEVKKELNLLDALQKNISTLNLNNTYNMNSESNSSETSSSDKQIAKLKSKISALENKIPQANGDQRSSLQAQIGSLYSQMLSLLAADIK